MQKDVVDKKVKELAEIYGLENTQCMTDVKEYIYSFCVTEMYLRSGQPHNNYMDFKDYCEAMIQSACTI